MAIRRHTSQPVPQDFAMAPMVDMVFLLLVFFMCVTALSGGRSRHAVDLPQTAAAAAPAAQTAVAVVLSLDGLGNLSVDGAPCELAALPARLRALGNPGGALQARIRADAATPYAQIEALLAACARAGITRIAYAAHPAQIRRAGATPASSATDEKSPGGSSAYPFARADASVAPGASHVSSISNVSSVSNTSNAPNVSSASAVFKTSKTSGATNATNVADAAHVVNPTAAARAPSASNSLAAPSAPEIFNASAVQTGGGR